MTLSKGPRRRKLSEDTNIALRQLAKEMADDSIVNQALARYLQQVLEFVHEEYIAPLQAENKALKEALERRGEQIFGKEGD
jgi:hypothetical protein